VLELRGITRRFGERTALDNVSLTLHPGEVVGFVGRNGAGKTTAMRVIMGLLEPDAGTVLWHGEPMRHKDRQSVGYMPEERGLYPKMSVLDQLRYFAELAGVAHRESRSHALRILTEFGLADRADEAVEKLSLGNQQRVQLTAALLGRPALLVLDEPFSGLDPVGVDALVLQLQTRLAQGVGMLFSSHQLELVERLADRVIVIDHGRIVEDAVLDKSPDARGSLAERFRALVVT
jgi:ABC-2 type transport system ATP-binding protein